MPDNEHLIIAVKSSPVKKPEETGAALPVKDLFVGIPRRPYVKLTCLVTCQVVPYVKYNLNYFRFNGTHVEDRRNPTALATTFEFWAMTSQSFNPTEILLVVKNKNIAVKFQKYKIQ